MLAWKQTAHASTIAVVSGICFLLVVLCRLLQEQEAWVQLLAQYNSMSTAPIADAAQGSAAAAGATPQHEQGDSDTQAASAGAEAGATPGNKGGYQALL
jgi:hypothetical protein